MKLYIDETRGKRYHSPVLNSFESVKMSQTLYLKALGLFFVRP